MNIKRLKYVIKALISNTYYSDKEELKYAIQRRNDYALGCAKHGEQYHWMLSDRYKEMYKKARYYRNRIDYLMNKGVML